MSLTNNNGMEMQLQRMLAEQAQKQGKVENILREHGLERSHLQAYIKRAKANSMLQSIVTLRNYIDNQINVGTGR